MTQRKTKEEVIANVQKKVEVMSADQMELLLGGSMPKFEETPAPERPASDKQYAYYVDLCNARHEPIQEQSSFTSVSINTEINRVKDLPYWKEVSEKQIERITTLCGQLKMALPNFANLNGAYGGSASQLIQKLTERAKNIVLPISEKQLTLIKVMQDCPDCEAIENIEEMTSTEANEYISKHKTDFYKWKNERLTDSQLLTILLIQCRIEDKDTTDVSDEFRIVQGLEPLTIMEKISALLPRQSISYHSWIQLDQKSATKQIEQMELELSDESLKETTLEPEEMRGIKERDHEDERKELRALVANLYGSLGQAFETEFYESMDWNGLKDLVDLAKLYGADVKAMMENMTIFTEAQKDALTA
jgi:hypothetical protein